METAKRQAQLLHLYLLELKNTLKKMDALNVLQRNPYIRSKAAKLVLQEVSESMQLSDEAGLKGVRGASQILFDFQDEILRQEILHQLLLKEETLQHRLQQFMTVNEHLLHKVLELPDQTRYEKQP